MLRENRGFTLVEMIVVMAIFIVVIAVTTDAFNSLLKNALQQSGTAESNIEGVVGLEIFRKDLASAGFGLPWSFPGTITYHEVDKDIGDQEKLAATFNGDPVNSDQHDVPRAIFGGNNVALSPSDNTVVIDGSDYLVVRATSVGATQTTQRWSYMNYTGATKPSTITPVSWTKDNLSADDWVAVVRMGLSGEFTKELVVSGGSFATTYGNLVNFTPDQSKVTHFIYGLYYKDAGNNPPRMPFNRVDYYARVPKATDNDKLPNRCAPHTGILYKAIVTQKNGDFADSELPLLDCVADMQVVYTLDSASNGAITETDTLTGLSAQQIREQLKSVQVYILTHDGGRDRNYTYPNKYIAVGPSADGITTAMGRKFDIETIIGTNWQHYRWKLYRMSVKPANVSLSIQ